MRSTIEFSGAIVPVLDDLRSGGFDLKDIVNAGVLLFSQLSGDEQKDVIRKVKSNDEPFDSG